MGNNKIYGLITAIGYSKGIPNKNMSELNGYPLIYYSAKAALESKYLEKVFLSTDSEKIAEYGANLGLEIPFLRPKHLAKDSSKSIDAVKHLIENCSLNGAICLIQPTSPLLTNEDVTEAVRIHKSLKRNVLSVSESSFQQTNTCNINSRNEINFIKKNTGEPRQKLCKYFKLNGAIFINSVESIFSNNSLVQDNSIAYIMPKWKSIDIDDLTDLKMAELILKNKAIFKEY